MGHARWLIFSFLYELDMGWAQSYTMDYLLVLIRLQNCEEGVQIIW